MKKKVYILKLCIAPDKKKFKQAWGINYYALDFIYVSM